MKDFKDEDKLIGLESVCLVNGPPSVREQLTATSPWLYGTVSHVVDETLSNMSSNKQSAKGKTTVP